MVPSTAQTSTTKPLIAKPLPAAQPLQDGRRGETVGHGADGGLE